MALNNCQKCLIITLLVVVAVTVIMIITLFITLGIHTDIVEIKPKAPNERYLNRGGSGPMLRFIGSGTGTTGDEDDYF